MPPDTAQRLLDVAGRVFAELGFEGASVRGICEAADVNVQAIQYHFGSKEALYRAVVERFLDEQDAIVARLVTSRAASVEDLRTRLFFFLDTLLEFWVRVPGLDLIYRESKRHGPSDARIVETLGAVDRALIAMLASSQEAGLVRADLDLPLVAAALTERAGSWAVDADLFERYYGTCARDPETRHDQLGKYVDVVLFGIAGTRSKRRGG